LGRRWRLTPGRIDPVHAVNNPRHAESEPVAQAATINITINITITITINITITITITIKTFGGSRSKAVQEPLPGQDQDGELVVKR
jgi:hypothetical protein